MENEIKNFVTGFVKNYSTIKKTKTTWKKPLVAYADANDPIFKDLKQIISSDHLLPEDILPAAKSVIAFFIPFDEKIPKSNVSGKNCSIEWCYAYIETNQLIIDINDTLKDFLKQNGFDAAVTPPTHNFDEERLISNWSHKHVAYIAGLGKFGVHQLLITEQGCCGRLGSIVTEVKVKATMRSNNEFCLFRTKGICLACVNKCVNGALQKDSYDRHKCYEMCLENDRFHEKLGTTDICGKCSTIVPCSFINPNK
ncbi:MAG: epoxyqueuosine reductase [Nanoarchaeota archaeon]|nr:epoxyqueuosine reductase [Nanoarchaeota archaeon]